MEKHLTRKKPYKARPPRETIFSIKQILEGLGFVLFEEPVTGSNLFNSIRLNAINPANGQIIFSTFGKGITVDWAAASAWGEMLERISNLAFYMMLIYPTQPELFIEEGNDFKYYPDEKVFSMRDHIDEAFVKNYIALTGQKLVPRNLNCKVTGIPFLNISTQKTEYFPFRAILTFVGSNGMCSGNTREEALIQGISEIFERYVLKAFYLNPFSPPDIPLHLFEGTEISQKIDQVMAHFGYRVTIKDCSMGRAYPVVGVLIRDKQNGYAFHLGADPSPITALERCFTEMFQGGNICFQSIEELHENLPYNLGSNFWMKNFSLTISAYAGQWPGTILEDKMDYHFNGFPHPDSTSDEDDLQYLLSILKNESRQIFVRDNSFLGQPAYYIYIPGMSEMTNQPDHSFSSVFLEFDYFIPVLTNLENSSEEKITEMKELINRYIEASPNKEFRTSDYFLYNKKHPIAGLSSKQLLELLTISKAKGSWPEELFNNFHLPHCFNCNDCELEEVCNYSYLLGLWEKLKKMMR